MSPSILSINDATKKQVTPNPITGSLSLVIYKNIHELSRDLFKLTGSMCFMQLPATTEATAAGTTTTKTATKVTTAARTGTTVQRGVMISRPPNW